MTKRYFVQTWGCQMNVYDSVRMAEVLEAAGWCLEQDSNAADLIVLNTCHIREKATQKVRSALGRIRQNNPDALVAVAGCVAQAEGALLAPVADVIVGPQAIQHLAHLVEQKLAARVQEQVLLQHSVAETPPSPRAIAAGGNASAGGNTAAGGNASAGGNTAAGGNASAGGDVAAGGNASVGGNATADGNASAGGNATAARTTTGGERFQKPRHRTRASQAVVSDAFNPEEKFNTLPVERDNVGTRDFLTIQEGCDKFCTFCVVPYTRGPEFSRSAVAIGNEAKKMVASGVRDLVLLGQNVNGWRGESPHGGQWNFGELMMYLEELLPDLKRMSYTTSHPRDMHDAMYTAHKESKILMPWLHLPVQSGSDTILARMNRKHTVEQYLDIIARCRETRPDMAFSSDFIVGFPGETEADHAATLKLVRAVGFSSAYAFVFSPRPGAPAATYTDTVDLSVAKQRLQGLQQVLDSFMTRFNEQQVGTTMSLLFEKPGKKPNQWVARSPYMQAVHVDLLADEAVGIQTTVQTTAQTSLQSSGRPGVDAALGREGLSSRDPIGSTFPCRITGTTTHGLTAALIAA